MAQPAVIVAPSAPADRVREVRDRAPLGPMEVAYAAVVLQSLLYNPVVHDVGSLQIYLNTLTWPVVAAGALIRWAAVSDRRLSRALAAVLLGTAALVWAVLFQMTFVTATPLAGGNLLRLLYLPLGAVAALAVYRSIDRILDLVVVGAALKGLIVLAPLAQGGALDLAHRLTVIELGGHNSFGAFLVFLALTRTCTWAFGGRRPGALVIASLCVCVACVVLTFSRTAFGALVVGLAAMSVMVLWRKGQRRRSLGASFLLAVALAPIVLGGPLKERLTTLGHEGVSGRTEIWSAAWRGFTDSPLAGHGFGSFRVYSSSVVDLTRPLEVGGVTYSAHSVPLQVLYEWGVLGLFLSALATWVVVRRCWSPVILPAVVAAAVVAAFETFQYVVQVSWVCGLVLAVGLRYQSDGARSVAGDSRSGGTPRAPALVSTQSRSSARNRSVENPSAWRRQSFGSNVR